MANADSKSIRQAFRGTMAFELSVCVTNQSFLPQVSLETTGSLPTLFVIILVNAVNRSSSTDEVNEKGK